MLLKPPEICAPVRPSIPSGFSAKLMIGRVFTSLSRTTAKRPESCSACSDEAGPIACAWPRWAIARVTCWKACRPSSVKLKETLGWLASSNSCRGSVMSVPVNAGLSFSAYQPGAASSIVVPAGSKGSSETTTVPTGTSSTMPLRGRSSPRGVRYRSFLTSSGPEISLCGSLPSNR